MTKPVSTQRKDNLKLGKNFSLFGFIMSLIPAGWLAGLIFSIVGYRLSKAAGVRNKLAIAGIWISSIFLGLLLIGFLVVVAVSYFDTQAREQDMKTDVAASLVESSIVEYQLNTGSYPTLDQLKSSQPFDLLPDDHPEPSLVEGDQPAEARLASSPAAPMAT